MKFHSSLKRKVWKRAINKYIREINEDWSTDRVLAHWKFKLHGLYRDTCGLTWYGRIGLYKDDVLIEEKEGEVDSLITPGRKNWIGYMANKMVLKDIYTAAGQELNYNCLVTETLL